MGDCDLCTGDNHISYRCNECGGQFCSEHRLPEAHNCPVLRRSRLTWTDDGTTDATSNATSEATETAERRCTACDRRTEQTCDHCGRVYCKRHRSPRIHDCDELDATAPGDGVPPRPAAGSGGVDYTRYAFLIAVVVTVLAVGAMAYGAPGDVPGTDDSQPDAGLGNDSTVTVTATATTTETVDQTQTEDSSGLDAGAVEELVHERTNEVRSDHGLGVLAMDAELREIAGDHSEDMAENGYFAHETPAGETLEDRYDDAGYNCRVSTGPNQYSAGGENLAYTFAFTPVETADGGTATHESADELADAVVQQWMNSEGHRENLLQSHWENEGIGVDIIENPDGPGQKVYATQNFC